nr:insulin-like growth factor-binding protein 7 [Penaeus vannamei]
MSQQRHAKKEKLRGRNLTRSKAFTFRCCPERKIFTETTAGACLHAGLQRRNKAARAVEAAHTPTPDSTMRASLLLLFAGAALLCLLRGAEAHECHDDCKDAKCPDTSDCNHGTVKEHCGCCDVCKRRQGEKCGGHEHEDGECDPPFECKNGFCC